MLRFRLGHHCRSLGIALSAFASTTESRKNLNHSQIDQYPNLSIGHTNWMSQCLCPKIYSRLAEKATRFGFTLDDAIQPGVDDPAKPSDVHMGIVAGDEESYDLYRELFECVIRSHFGQKSLANAKHPVDTDFGRLLIDDRLVERIVSFRVRICRNLSGHPFSGWVTRAGRRLIETRLVDVFQTAFNKGRSRQIAYYSLVDLPDEYKVNPPYSAYWRSTGVNRDWPDARGALVISNNNNSLEQSSTVVSVNDRDHIRMWMELRGLKTSQTFIKSLQSFFGDVQIIEDALLAKYGAGFAWDDRFGYLTSNPSDVGTALKLEIEINLPKLSKDPRFPSILRSKCGQRLKIIRLDEEGSIVKITNTQRIGISEVDLIQIIMDDLKLLVHIDQNLVNSSEE